MSNIDLNDDEEGRKNLLDAFSSGEPASESREVARVDQRSVGRRVWGAQLVLKERDTRKVLEEIKIMAAAAGEEWYYRWPVNETYKENGVKKTRVKWIEGLGIKGANAVSRIYGNCDVQVDEIEDMGAYWYFHARFIDLQTGFSMSRPLQQRKGQQSLKTDAARSADIAFQIGASKAIRNVVNNALSDYSRFALEQALDANVAKYAERLPQFREKIAARFEDLNFDIARVEAVIGRKIENWKPRDVARVMAMGVSVNDEMATWDELCPPLGQPVVGLADQNVAGEEDKPSTEAANGAAKDLEKFAEGKPGEVVDPKTGEVTSAVAAAAETPQQETKVEEVDPALAERLTAAFQLGRDARQAGKSRRVPKAVGSPEEVQQWLAGFDAGEREPGEEG